MRAERCVCNVSRESSSSLLSSVAQATPSATGMEIDDKDDKDDVNWLTEKIELGREQTAEYPKVYAKGSATIDAAGR